MEQHPNGPFGATPATPQPTGGQFSPPQAVTAPKSSTPTPRGGVAEGIFAEVERMTAGGAMNRSDAFESISQRTGRRAGTVAANYYRIARKRGTVAPRSARGSGRPAGSRTVRGGDVAAVIARLEAATKDLADLLRTQETELVRLRRDVAQFDKLRELIAKNT